MLEPLKKNMGDRRRYSGRSAILGVMVSFLTGLVFPVQAQSLLEDAYRQAEKTVLPKGSIAIGSGAFISSTAILTSAHVIAGCRTFAVENPYAGFRWAKIAYVDRRRDAAILQVSGPRSVNFLGFPSQGGGGDLRILGYSASSPADRDPNSYRTKRLRSADATVIALNANVPAGMSGGPVIDESYGLVGILTGRLDGAATVASPVSSFPADILRYFNGQSSGRISSAVVKIRCNR
jgi:S1-C subfamily serine protease